MCVCLSLEVFFFFLLFGSRSQSFIKLEMGGLNLPGVAESHTSVTHIYDTDGGGGGIAAQQREKQTGLQGDREDF